MNILPKKRWHVRTKENIARVKQDEAKYEEEQRQIKYRAQLAEQESRTELLRRRQIVQGGSTTAIATFQAPLLSERSVELLEGNKEYEAEKRAEKEAEEKSIGLLTYLGQSVLESNGQRPWYDVHPKRQSTLEREKNKVDECEAKKKCRADPLCAMNKISEWFDKKREEKAREENVRLRRANSCITAMPSLFPNDIAVPKSANKTTTLLESIAQFKQSLSRHKSKGRKRHKHTSSAEDTGGSDPNKPGCLAQANDVVAQSSCAVSEAAGISEQQRLDALRAERLQRERKERERAALVIAQAMGLPEALRDPCDSEKTTTDERELPFNSAFNPELAANLAERRRKFKESRKRPYPSD